MPNGDTVTKVCFDLWVVLAALVVLGISSFTFLYAEGKETKTKQQDVIARVVRLETQQAAILCGIEELKQGQKDVMAQMRDAARILSEHEKATSRAARVKSWNDIK